MISMGKYQPGFYFQQKFRNSTLFGASISLILLVFFISFIYITLIQVINKHNYNQHREQVFLSNFLESQLMEGLKDATLNDILD